MDKEKKYINKEERELFLKLAEILAREKMIKEGEKMQLKRRIWEKWKES